MPIFIIIITVLFCFLPVVFWGYIFSYIDDSLANRRRFIFGIIAGCVSTLPILYLGNHSSISLLSQFNIFEIISGFSSIKSFFLILGLIFITFFVSISGYLLGLFQNKWFEHTITFVKNIALFSFGSAIFSGIFFLLYWFFKIFPVGDVAVSDGVYFGDFLFNSVKLVVFYYLIIGFIEETSKHFHFLSGTLPSVKNTKEIVLLSLFIALGFSLTENVIYLFNLYQSSGIDGNFLKVYLFRSCFSLMLHVVCSALLAHAFSIVWYEKKLFSFFPLLIFLSGILASVILHSVFDISLLLGLSFVPFIYFLGGYLYVSGIFYRKCQIEE